MQFTEPQARIVRCKMKPSIQFLIVISILLIAIAGCSATPVETPILTQPAAGQPPDTGSNDDVVPSPTETSAAVPTPYDAESQPGAEAIYIAAPGLMSDVVSPLAVDGIADSALGSAVTVQLFQMSESGAPYEGLLAQQAVPVQPQMGTTGPFQAELTFTPKAGNPVGWVAVSFSDPDSGALLHVATTQVTLLTSGNAQITIPEQSAETIQIDSPTSGQAVSGGQVEIRGVSEYFFESTVGVMLCAVGGELSGEPHAICGNSALAIAQGNLMIDSPDMGIGGPINGNIAYQVDAETPARLVIYALSPRDGSILHLSSVAVTLEP